MIKKALLLVGGLGVTTLVLFGRDACQLRRHDLPPRDQLGEGKRAGRVPDRPGAARWSATWSRKSAARCT